jgi:hypothetical protein
VDFARIDDASVIETRGALLLMLVMGENTPIGRDADVSSTTRNVSKCTFALRASALKFLVCDSVSITWNFAL